MSRPGLRRVLPGLLLGLLAAALVLGPSLRSGALIGDEGLDVWSHVWGMGFVSSALMAGRLPWHTAQLAWPDGGVLWYIDPLGASVGLPLRALFGAVGAYNGLLAVQVALAGLGGWAYGRALGGRGWIAGIGLATTPFLLGEIDNGITEACWLGLVPLAAAAAARGRAGWAGFLVGLAFAATPYHGVSAALLVATHLFPWKMRPVLLASVCAGVLALPSVLVLKAALDAPDALTRKPAASENLPVFRINAVDPVAFVRPGDFWSVPLHGPLEAPFRRTPYLGLGLLVLAGVGVRRRWPLVLPAGVCGVLALGPYLWHNGDFVLGGDGLPIPLPFHALLLASGVSMDHPLRFVGGALVVVAGLADAAVTSRRLAPVLAGIVAVEQLCFAPAVWPLPTADATVPAVYGALPADGRAVIDLPADRGDSIATNRYLYWAGVHGRGIPYAAKVGSQGFPSLNAALRTWTAAGRLRPLPASAPGVPAADADLAGAVRELAREGFGWVVLHPELLARPELGAQHRAVIDPLLGAPREVGGDLVWEIPR